jgi:hypothetical protein
MFWVITIYFYEPLRRLTHIIFYSNVKAIVIDLCHIVAMVLCGKMPPLYVCIISTIFLQIRF